jgi:hypothetical protein
MLVNGVLGGGGVSSYTISGTVYDADGSTAVAGATVALGALSAVSAANGTYTISGVALGESGSMTCTKTGYVWTAITVAEITESITGQNYTNTWWAAGGASASILGRYPAIGAASRAASYSNLANPGTNDLTEGVADVDWTTQNGWAGADYKYLLTGIVPTSDDTVIVHFGDIGASNTNGIFGAIDGAKYFAAFQTNYGYLSAKNASGATAILATQLRNNGVIAIAGNTVYFNGVSIGACDGAYNGANALALMAANAAGVSPIVGKVKSAVVYSSTLNASQISMVTNGMRAIAPNISIASPTRYQVFQRSGTTGTISISGTVYGTSNVTVEASWSGGAYADIATGVTGAFSGSLASQTHGQGTLTLRIKTTTVTASVDYVGIGDVFVIAGQSNASGRGTNTDLAYSHATLKAGNFGNGYDWKELSSLYFDDNTIQTDTVSGDAAYNYTSAWIPMTTLFLADQAVPVAFIPCAKGGTTIADWQPGADHSDRTTLYGSMNYRIGQVGGAKAVLLWLGENDVVAGTAEATFNSGLDTLANAVNSDRSIKVMVCKIENAAAYDETAVNNAINTAWGDNTNVLTGPDFSDLTPTGDGSSVFHFKSDAEMSTTGGRWWNALVTAFGY